MPKQPKIRPSYKHDVAYLRRLCHAIEHDEAKPLWWRKQAIEHVTSVISIFEGAENVQAETQTPTQGEEAEAGVRGA